MCRKFPSLQENEDVVRDLISEKQVYSENFLCFGSSRLGGVRVGNSAGVKCKNQVQVSVGGSIGESLIGPKGSKGKQKGCCFLQHK